MQLARGSTGVSLQIAVSILVVVCGAAIVGSPVRGGTFQAGAATSNITPPIGFEIIGGFVPFPSTHIHDELHARCLVLDDGQTRIALVVCDLLGIDLAISEEARKQIAARYGIPRGCVMISATHTHSASSAMGKDPRLLGQPIDDYQQFVTRRIVDGVARALENRRPAEMAFGTVEVPEHVFNRRWYMRPGTVPLNPFGGTDQVKMNPPRGSENLTEPAGPVDPTVSFMALRQTDGRPIGLFAAYSLHYVGGVGQGHVSADYYGVFCEHLKRLVAADGVPSTESASSDSPSTEKPSTEEPSSDAPPYVAMMANGTSGDINNINFRQPRPRQKPYEQMRHVGRDVAEKVHAALASLEYGGRITLAARYREPEIAWRKPTDAERAWAKATLAAGPKSERDLSYIYAQRTLYQAEYPETTTAPLQVIRIGDVCLATMPFEVFCEIGLEFKSRCPVQPAFMVELAHGYFGYLPTPRHHRLGGYETWLGTNRVEPTASDKLLGILLEMAGELDTSPEPAHEESETGKPAPR
jgi:hypothetical protein